MNIYLTSDNIKSKTIDQKFMEDIAVLLRTKGHTVTVFLPVDPNSHMNVMKIAPAGSFIVDIYGGACAGTIKEMGEAWFKTMLGTSKKMIIFRAGATVITDLAWLPRAYDDDFSPESFSGLANPDKYLLNNGYTYAYADTPELAYAAIIKQTGGIQVGDLSNTTGAVPLAVFIDMMARYDKYLAANGVAPNIIYIKTDKVDWVTKECFIDMRARYNKYIQGYGVQPALIYFQAPKPSRVVGALQAQLESFLGQFNSFTEFYNKCKGRGYSYYYNDVKTLQQEVDALRLKSGLNCSDASQLFGALATEMGYQWRYVHVQCNSGGHIRGQILGKEFATWTRVDAAACISVGSQYDIGKVWCDYDNAHIETSNWILVDDGA